MSEILSIAAKGAYNATGRFEASARRVASDKTADLPAELVNQKMAEAEFAANLAVLDAARKTVKNTLDILV